MNNLDEILEECLDEIASGESTVEECLARNPSLAGELQPYLAAAAQLQRGRAVRPSPVFAARLRSELMQKTQAPRRSGWVLPVFFRQMALTVSIMVFAFIGINTAFAQVALPGEPLYEWKLASESFWRVVTTDPIGTELQISGRRIGEYSLVSKDEVRRARVLNGYHELLVRLNTAQDEQERARILSTLKSHQDSLKEQGLSIPELDSYLAGGAAETGGGFPITTPDGSISRPTPNP